MTTGMFHEIFSTLVRIVLGPNYLVSLGKMKGPELIVETMRALDYPMKLVKSSFVNLTKQTFPTALGVLGKRHPVSRFKLKLRLADGLDCNPTSLRKGRFSRYFRSRRSDPDF